MKKKLTIILIMICLFIISNGCGLLNHDETATESFDASRSVQMMLAVQQECLRIPTIINSMTVEEKVAQLFIARFPASEPLTIAADYQPGGFIFFAADFSDREPASFLSLAQQCNDVAKLPLLMGVDEEGGTVNRISRYSQYRDYPFSSPQELYDEGGLEAVRADTVEKCQLLKSLGLNLNFAPVCDISTNANDYIYYRTTGRGAAETADYVTCMVETMNQEQVGSVLKHFPGYGNNSDTHSGLAYDNRSYESFQNNDFLPFQAGIEAGASMVLVSHNIVACMDEDMPASLSPAVHRILREELGFKGVIITDDLVMGAIKQYTGSTSPAVAAVEAGNDMLCSSDFLTHYNQLLEAVNNGTISERRLDQSIYRIICLKEELGLM